MYKNILLILVVLGVILVGGSFLLPKNTENTNKITTNTPDTSNPASTGGPTQTPDQNPTPTPSPTPSPTPTPMPTPNPDGLFSATPLIDFAPGQLYLGKFPGMLYENSNEMPAAHAADGTAAAAAMHPINGKIVIVGIGMSNWTGELCNGAWPNCGGVSFIKTANSDSRVNHSNLVLVDCAKGGQTTLTWLDDSRGNYTTCLSKLSSQGLSKDQVQAILWLNANAGPITSLSSSTVCTPTSTVEACAYTYQLGKVIRYVKQQFPNTKQFFVHSRIYAGYATTKLNPEPYAYEYGFATKWLVQAQIDQIKTGKVDSVAGDLSYNIAPWIAWGPYFWASGETPRSDGLVWKKTDLETNDGTHPSRDGIKKVAGLMLNWYLASPYTPWFRAQ